MRQIEYNIYAREGRNASSKAKVDVSNILQSLGYKRLYKPSRYRIIRILQQFISILFLKKDTYLFIQYHSNISFFYRLLAKFKAVRKIAVIHDLESLRGQIKIEEEMRLLNGFDFIISHNPHMTKYIKDHGVQRGIVNLYIFDYLLNDGIKINNSYRKDVVFFAGNLCKSHFLKYLSSIHGVSFNIYGAKYDGIETLLSLSNVDYKGSFSPEQLIANIEGGWGLVWDGDSLDTCSGIAGEYMKYNNPHKVSMCIVSERPVIIWRQAAMADYIKDKGLGIVVDSLYDISKNISGISHDTYQSMIQNVLHEKARLIKGLNLKEAICKVYTEMI